LNPVFPALLAGALVGAIDPRAESAERPNVLLISIDDLNDWVGALETHPQARTPNLDALARRGVLFANAHCQAPVCTPSRASLFTGRQPSSTGLYFLQPQLRQLLDEDPKVITLVERFARSGYETLGVGKLHHGSGEAAYFETYGTGMGSFGPSPNPKLHYPGGHPLWDWGPGGMEDGDMPDSRVAAWAIERLAEERTEPFFLAVGFWRPHVPMVVPGRWFEERPLAEVILPVTRPDDLDDISAYARSLTIGHPAPRHEWMVEHEQWGEAVRSYLASTSFVDHQVGRVLDALAASPHAEDTLVVLFSDHGFHLGEKGRWAKRSLWEEATRVPLILAGPGIAPAVSPRPVGLIDLYPTLLELCGLEADPALEGRSLRLLLEEPEREWPWPALTTFGPGNHSVRSTHWRYVRYGDGKEELYDHRSDPHEFSNLAADERLLPVLSEHRRWLPKNPAPVQEGSGSAGLDAWRAAEALAD